MNMKMKKLISVMLCIVLSLGIYFYLCMIVIPKDINDSGGTLYYNGMGCLAEPKNSLDVIVFGNSDVYSGFSPAVLQQKFGYTSYASGRALQDVESINDLLRKTLRTQNPGLIILETDCFYEERTSYLGDFDLWLAPFVYHSRWKEIKPRDFYQYPSRESKVDINKGYIASDLVFKTEMPENYMGDPNAKPTEIPKKNVKQIEDFIRICKNKNIEVLFVELPSPHSWTYAKHNAVQNLASKHKIPFLDLNIQPDKYDLNLETDFRDNGNHLNSFGAAKVTEYIGSYMKEKYADLLSSKAIARMPNG